MPVRGRDYLGSTTKDRFDDAFRETVGLASLPLLFAAKTYLASALKGSDPFYNRPRIGRYYEPFVVEKLKTMHDVDEGSPEDCDKASPRIVTRLARIIRDLGIDELPQVQQIGSGRPMSVVGPRPMTENYLEIYEQNTDPGLFKEWFSLYGELKPGLTGPSQLVGVGTDSRARPVLTNMMEADLRYYPEASSLDGDLRIVSTTPWALINGIAAKNDASS